MTLSPSSHRAAALLAITILLSACAPYGSMSESATPAQVSNGILVNPAGMTLYTFDKDRQAAGTSACNGTCAANWPPLTASSSDKATGAFSLITREDGTRQWAYDGKPLYLYIKDKAPGDRKGDGFKNLWHVATATGRNSSGSGSGSMGGGSY